MRSAVKLNAQEERLVALLTRRLGVTGTTGQSLLRSAIIPFFKTGHSVVEIEKILMPLIPMITSIENHIELATGEGA
tara:strand:- start:6496 stop:6726 length:231 start_codon:yes stop_codon:yes gene_type:complete